MRRLAALFLLMAAPAAADPWVGPGDARLRTDIELLRAHGYIVGPIDAWPLPWSQINRGLQRAQADGALPPHLAAAVGRVRTLSEFAGRKTHFELRASATNEAALVRTFDRVARNRADASVSASHDLGNLHVTWGGSWQSDGNDGRPATQHGNGFAPDPSYVALRLGSNWALYGGWFDNWWGAGHDGAMLFSSSARPMPRVGFRRLEPFNIDFPLLRWLGPVTFDMFVGIADEQRDFDNPAMIGMRFAFQPTPWFEIGLNRGLQLCGSGRPCDARTIGKALIGFGDFDNTGTLDEPGNQLAGFDMSYRRPIGDTGQILKLHFATTAEDADNILIEQFARQIGAGISGPVGKDGALLDAGFEYVDSQAAKFFGRLMGSSAYPGSTYNNFIYYDGWTYGRRPIGHSLDGDARALTMHLALTDTRNRRWNLAARHIMLNLNNYETYRISQKREEIVQWEGGVNWPTRIGDVKAATRLQYNAPNTPTRDPFLVQGEISWTTRF
ncbi:capsule assembly Wzi family protein [Sandaracinobacter sp. RS1-74]|uniref:capsule assembly Wzi family protein n=1 Tax=Sandaracinobacteroides sayramensis TaxID=2913411 RepID=UPI001EDA1F01|nr:capsule assembly Wzi family protein [Sandaracinobacteroides sayramensis]MCG2842374.1 capsule assembly Wzi family protein [Sandaracinobacteroides sayramensis]